MALELAALKSDSSSLAVQGYMKGAASVSITSTPSPKTLSRSVVTLLEHDMCQQAHETEEKQCIPVRER